LAQGQGGCDIRTGGILQYFEDLNFAPNAEIGLKDFFEIASNRFLKHAAYRVKQFNLDRYRWALGKPNALFIHF